MALFCQHGCRRICAWLPHYGFDQPKGRGVWAGKKVFASAAQICEGQDNEECRMGTGFCSIDASTFSLYPVRRSSGRSSVSAQKTAGDCGCRPLYSLRGRGIPGSLVGSKNSPLGKFSGIALHNSWNPGYLRAWHGILDLLLVQTRKRRISTFVAARSQALRNFPSALLVSRQPIAGPLQARLFATRRKNKESFGRNSWSPAPGAVIFQEQVAC